MSSSPPFLANTLSVRTYNASHGSHTHDHFQVLVGLEGVLELEVQGRGQRIGVGDGCVVPPGAAHDFAATAGSRCLVLDTAHTQWDRRNAAAPANPAHTLALARYLAHSLEHAHPMALHHGPLLLLESWMPTTAPISHTTPARRPIDWPALAAWAQAHWQAPLGVTDLADKVHLSASQFSTRCRAEQGESPMQWLRRQRLAQARIWRAAGMGVADTARRAGYRSPSALTAALRREALGS